MLERIAWKNELQKEVNWLLKSCPGKTKTHSRILNFAVILSQISLRILIQSLLETVRTETIHRQTFKDITFTFDIKTRKIYWKMPSFWEALRILLAWKIWTPSRFDGVLINFGSIFLIYFIRKLHSSVWRTLSKIFEGTFFGGK